MDVVRQDTRLRDNCRASKWTVFEREIVIRQG